MTDAKPATDEQIAAMRARLATEQIYEMPPWSGNTVALLIARIDAERARVKALEDALRTVQWDVRGKCTACAGWNMSPAGETVKAHTPDCPVGAALKEASNG